MTTYNKILILFITLLLVSITPATAVTIKETQPQEEVNTHIFSNIKELTSLYKNIDKIMEKLCSEVLEMIKKGVIPSFLLKYIKIPKELKKEINTLIDEINTTELAEILGESHPVTQNMKYIQKNKPNNYIELILLYYTVKKTEKTLEKSTDNQDKIKRKKLLETRLKTHYLYTLLFQAVIIATFYINFISICIALTGIAMLNSNLGLGWKVLGIGVTATGACTGYLLFALDSYFSSEPEEREKAIEQEIEEIKQETNVSATPTPEETSQKLNQLKRNKKLLEFRLICHYEIVEISEKLPKYSLYGMGIGTFLLFIALITYKFPALSKTVAYLGLSLLGYSALCLALSCKVYFSSNPEKREDAIKERIQEIEKEIHELEQSETSIPKNNTTNTTTHNNTNIHLENNTIIGGRPCTT